VRLACSASSGLGIRLAPYSPPTRGLHSFPFQLNLSSLSTISPNLTNECVLQVLKLSSNVNECKPLPPTVQKCYATVVVHVTLV